MASALHISALLLLCLFGSSYANGLFSSLEHTLVINASPKNGTVLKAGEDTIIVAWGLNQSIAGITAEKYKKMVVKLCYAPISQENRAWRKTKPEISKDKTCQFKIVTRPFNTSSTSKFESFEYLIEREIPFATYFVRVYALDSDGHEVAYGQSTDATKSTNLFEIQAITGRHASLDIAAGVFSAFSIVSLIGFFYVEKRKATSINRVVV
ncbi:hypothetical protein ACHQM5_010994 [Ranunculus cassubicifolius]